MAEYDKGVRIIKTDEEVKVFTDPYRLKIIDTFYAHEGPLTVKGVADIMGEVPAKVHYHVKKLIAIELLELDHIEVVNGINAKYYKLICDEFRLEFSKGQDQADYIQQPDQVEKMLYSLMDKHKADVRALRGYLVSCDDQEKERFESGNFSANDLYLSQEDYQEVMSTLKGIYKKYGKMDNNKRKYTSLISIMRKIEES